MTDAEAVAVCVFVAGIFMVVMGLAIAQRGEVYYVPFTLCLIGTGLFFVAAAAFLISIGGVVIASLTLIGVTLWCAALGVSHRRHR
jgi:hypothetical protein